MTIAVLAVRYVYVYNLLNFNMYNTDRDSHLYQYVIHYADGSYRCLCLHGHRIDIEGIVHRGSVTEPYVIRAHPSSISRR